MVFEGTFSRKSGGARGGAVRNDGTNLLCFAGAGPAGKKDYPLFHQP